ncbi:hypothetical protein Tco_1062523 [Tanacetum coccineum]
MSGRTVSPITNLYDISSNTRNEVNKIRAERRAHTLIPLAFSRNLQTIPTTTFKLSSNTSRAKQDNLQELTEEQGIEATLYVMASFKRLLQSLRLTILEPIFDDDQCIRTWCDPNNTIDSLDICYDRVQDDQDDTDDLDQERDLLASLIQKLKCEIDDSKNQNKFLESSNKALVDKLKGLRAHQDTVSHNVTSKEAQLSLYKTREDNEMIMSCFRKQSSRFLKDIDIKPGQSVSTL